MDKTKLEYQKLTFEDLSNWFRSGIKPSSQWGIGTEHEQFLFSKKDYKRLGYEEVPGIKAILKEIQQQGWTPIEEEGNLIALLKNGASITLEPGGQFELSGAIVSTVHQTYDETKEHCSLLNHLSEEMGFYNLPIGFDPLWKREDIPWMPKERYRYMKNWMPEKGELGLDMMTRTSSIQVNLDFSSEEDMVKKAQVSQAFQSVVMALFANSPFTERKPNGYLSYRSQIWEETDQERCGFLAFVLQDDFGFDKWTEYLLDVPMYFIYRNEEYSSANGMTFRQFMENEEYQPTLEDWEVHVSTVFPDIRLKKFLELRGADSGRVDMIAGLVAFWVGLLYDEQSLDAAHQLAKEMGVELIQGLRSQVPKNGLKAQYGSVLLQDVARELVQLSYEGLGRRAVELEIESEQLYLKPLQKIVETGETVADQILQKYNNEWEGNLYRLFEKK